MKTRKVTKAMAQSLEDQIQKIVSKSNPQHSNASSVSHTPMPLVTWDGCGINDTDEYASRLATFTERGRPFGDAIVRAVNSHEELLEAAKACLKYGIVGDEYKESLRVLIAKVEGE